MPTSVVCSQQRDRGFLTAEWTIAVALLLIPAIGLVTIMASWAEDNYTVAVAARNATRSVALTDGPVAQEPINSVVRQTLAERNLDPANVHIDVVAPTEPDGRLTRSGTVEVTITVTSTPVSIPGFGEVQGPTLTGSHTRRLNSHRSRE